MTAVLHNVLDDGVARLTLDHAARKNALSISLLRDLGKALPAAAKAGARAVILSGAGSAFSAGADLNDISGTSADSAYDREVESVGDAIRSFPGPVIAAISGPCMGAAVELALSCDVRVCDTEAFFEVPATRLGLLYNPRAIARLHRRFSSQSLARIFLLGERLNADAARDAGIVAQVFANGELDEAATQLARKAIGSSPRAAALTKKLLAELDRGPVDMAKWEALQLEILDSPERRAAISSAKAQLGLQANDSKADALLAKVGDTK